MGLPTEPPRAWRDLLRDNLVANFSLDELEDLGYWLGIEAGTLSGDTPAKKACEIILFLEHHEQLGDLALLGKKLRPGLVWELPVGAGLGEKEGTGLKEKLTGLHGLSKAGITSETPPPVPMTREGISSSSPQASGILVIDTPFHLELVRVPAGEFLMGSRPAQDKDAMSVEQPQHQVYVSEFYVGKFEVTNAQYAAYARDEKIQFDPPIGRDNHPVVLVSWRHAVAFCRWLSRVTGRNVRLPTEAEWEKAARGTNGRIYPWGDEWVDSRANTSDDGVCDSTPVDRYSPDGDSPYGVADMVGNVWEWVADWYDENEYQQHVKFDSPVNDPTGPLSGTERVLHGGSWYDDRSYARAAFRNDYDPDERNIYFGFRVVISPT